MTRRPRLYRNAAVAALLAALSWSLLPDVAIGASGDVVETAKSVYELVPSRGGIQVTVDVRVENHTASTVRYVPCTEYLFDPYFGYLPYASTCPHTTNYFVNTAYVWVEDAATQLKAKADSGSVSTKVEKRQSGYRLLRLTFKSIFKNQARKVRLTYFLVGGQPRSGSAVRAGAAYASFCATGNGPQGGTVTIIVPGAFAVETFGGKVTKGTAGTKTTYASGQVADPINFYVCVEGTNESAFHRTTITAPSGRAVTVEAWPEDATWDQAVQAQVRSSIQDLESLIGSRLPGTGSIRVREVSTGVLGNYAGDFDPTVQVARMSEDLSQGDVVAHELSHAWFNKSLFNDTWLNEGYAEWAARTVTGGPLPDCSDPGGYPGVGRPSIGDWTYLAPKATDAEKAVVSYNYTASCFLLTDLAQEMGTDRMRQALQYLLHRQVPYLDAAPDRLPAGPVPVRTWLDAIDEVGLAPANADLDLAQNLLTRFGVELDTAQLARRSAARRAYHGYIADSAGWSVPQFISRAMADWRFDDATGALAVASTTRATASQADQALPGIDALNGPVRNRLEAAGSMSDVQTAKELATSQLEAATVVATSIAATKASRNPLQEIGLAGTDLSAQSVAAVAAVASGNGDEALAAAKQLTDELDGATSNGLLRVGIVTFVLVVCIGGSRVVLRRRRHALLLAKSSWATEKPGTSRASEDSANVHVRSEAVATQASRAAPEVPMVQDLAPSQTRVSTSAPGSAGNQPPISPLPGSWAAALQELERLRANGLISEPEYQARRAEIPRLD